MILYPVLECVFQYQLIFFFRCHVMEVESFEDEEVAKLLNDWFVSIKVRV